MYIGIVGIIGVGKSVLTRKLSERLGYRAYYEPVKENPYLDDYYNNKERYVCIMQFFMLTHRFRQHLEIQKLYGQNVGIVQDQIIFGDILYATMTHDLGFMNDRDFDTYLQHFRALEPLLRLPDVLIHLDTSIETALERIKQRGRTSEAAIDAGYLSALYKRFSDWTDSVQDRTNVFRLDWNSFRSVDEVVKEIESKLQTQLELPTT
ncbi:MAG: deoxynucleoside kinase [Patescibacteria group bacterium]|jgi:deoxyadenosine/deoxycytidine kinase